MNATQYSMARMYILCVRPGEVVAMVYGWSTMCHIVYKQTYTYTQSTTTILDNRVIHTYNLKFIIILWYIPTVLESINLIHGYSLRLYVSSIVVIHCKNICGNIPFLSADLINCINHHNIIMHAYYCHSCYR